MYRMNFKLTVKFFIYVTQNLSMRIFRMHVCNNKKKSNYKLLFFFLLLNASNSDAAASSQNTGHSMQYFLFPLQVAVESYSAMLHGVRLPQRDPQLVTRPAVCQPV